MSMFEVDRKGLAKILARRGKGFLLLELIQNALDEDGVTEVDVTLTADNEHRGYYVFSVSDDAPEGFADLRHAYTLFAESRKKTDVKKRGRWNLGEKLVLAVCESATIRTTKGTVNFEDGKRSHSRAKTSRGTVFTGSIKMKPDEALAATQAAGRVLPPSSIALTLNGHAVAQRQPLASNPKIMLTTEYADDEGYLRRGYRYTELRVFKPVSGEKPHLYELGIPVVEVDCAWHIDIGQKIPLNLDRDNVTPGYLLDVQTAVANLMHQEIERSPEIAAQPWVAEALGSDKIAPAAVQSVLTAKHGEKRVAFDPSDPEGTKIAVTQGFEVVHGGSYTQAQWANIRKAEALLPAGKVTPSPKPFHPGGEPLKIIAEADIKNGKAFGDYIRKVAKVLLGIERLEITYANDRGWHFNAAYRPGHLTIQKDFAGAVPQQCLDSLLIHEFAHHQVTDHLSSGFHEECCRLGSLFVAAVRDGTLP